VIKYTQHLLAVTESVYIIIRLHILGQLLQVLLVFVYYAWAAVEAVLEPPLAVLAAVEEH
jgi:hypothetical protein